ncbi:MAG: PIN domain-containing protein [Solirubrobacterales bacterium]|nr:PIN domain-containing protein [Solirubrobacterales bacterium]
MIVLDASAGVELLCRNGARGDWIAERLAGEFTVHVPALFDLEVLHALRGLEASEKLASTTLGAALSDLVDLRATRHDHERLRPRVWALRRNLTAYDAAYVALAELLEATLLTTDAPLARSSGHEARIEMPPS